jgi:CheY-like chemotaxis protein
VTEAISKNPPSAPGVILVAEDDVMLRNLVRTILQKNGYTVLVAADGAEALYLSQNHAGGIDLLLTDVQMPRVGGIAAFQQMRGQRPGIKVLLVFGRYTQPGRASGVGAVSREAV